MGKLSKRQVKRITHFFREKEKRASDQAARFLHRSPSGDARKKESVVRLMAGKVDQMIIVSSFVAPPLKTGLIDRFLVIAGVEKIEPVIILNKVDLLGDRVEGERVLSRYRSLGYLAFLTSAAAGEGVEALRELVSGRNSLFAGHSGVGKSSLLNALQSGVVERAEVKEVSGATKKGRHATTSIKLYRLDDNTVVFDLPGLKLASLYDIESVEIQRHFPEFVASAGGCRYNDCLHHDEPDCQVKKALERGEIDRERYHSYLRMITNPKPEF